MQLISQNDAFHKIYSKFILEEISSISETDLKELIDRISHHVLVNRIRVTEFVSDFDKLRSGLISDSIFERVLKTLRLNLSQKQIFSLSQHYRDSEKPDKIQWRKFIDDVSVIFFNQFLTPTPTGGLCKDHRP